VKNIAEKYYRSKMTDTVLAGLVLAESEGYERLVLAESVGYERLTFFSCTK